jgi:hypothetical protein
MSVWNIKVRYVQESRVHEFGILTTASWSEFHSMVCTLLELDPWKVQFAYYMSGEGFKSGLLSLKDKQDWKRMMQKFCKVELEK